MLIENVLHIDFYPLISRLAESLSQREATTLPIIKPNQRGSRAHSSALKRLFLRVSVPKETFRLRPIARRFMLAKRLIISQYVKPRTNPKLTP